MNLADLLVPGGALVWLTWVLVALAVVAVLADFVQSLDRHDE